MWGRIRGQLKQVVHQQRRKCTWLIDDESSPADWNRAKEGGRRCQVTVRFMYFHELGFLSSWVIPTSPDFNWKTKSCFSVSERVTRWSCSTLSFSRTSEFLTLFLGLWRKLISAIYIHDLVLSLFTTMDCFNTRHNAGVASTICQSPAPFSLHCKEKSKIFNSDLTGWDGPFHPGGLRLKGADLFQAIYHSAATCPSKIWRSVHEEVKRKTSPVPPHQSFEDVQWLLCPEKVSLYSVLTLSVPSWFRL